MSDKPSTRDTIIIKGARENNLKNISLNLPKEKLIAFSGVSGSGKSSLAFATIYEEGRRRYIDSLSSYARQFLGNTKKPKVDSIEGLTPAISIDQKTTHNSPRSTVGTMTEIYDYLRLLFARIGRPFCPKHNQEIKSYKLFDIVNEVFNYPHQALLFIEAPLKFKDNKSLLKKLKKLKESGYLRVNLSGEVKLLEELDKLPRVKISYASLIIDRIKIDENKRSRIFEAIETALKEGNGICVLNLVELGKREIFSEHLYCHLCGFDIPELATNLFSFNSPVGMCLECKGLGFHLRGHLDLLVPDPTRSIQQGAIRYFASTVNTLNLEWQEFDSLLAFYKIRKDVPFYELSGSAVEIIMHGSKDIIRSKLISEAGIKRVKEGFIDGLAKRVEDKFANTKSDEIRKWARSFLTELICESCLGGRLNPKALAIRVGGKNIVELTRLSVISLWEFIISLELDSFETQVAKLIKQELDDRLSFLINVGLDYLTLNNRSETLSGGEAQRIRLATQIGSKLTGILYVLDEPSIGLHQRDNDKLISTLRQIVDLGNTLIVVEHDHDTLLASDFIVDIGPNAGAGGGEIVYIGDVEGIKACGESITGLYLSEKLKISIPKKRRPKGERFLEVEGARHNNLKSISIRLPLYNLIAVTGVSGSGKSSLVNDVIVKNILYNRGDRGVIPGALKSIKGHGYLSKVLKISQSSIGRTPRSNPATYTSVFNDIRELFAKSEAARERGYTQSRFSFNLSGGRCDRCEGDGLIKITMQFLPDVFINCSHCNGKRFNQETLQVLYRGHSIADVLDLTVAKAAELFESQPKILAKLQTLIDVGLDYIKLGQPATTLSGGEAQRVKLATHLQKKLQSEILYVLDEPTTGLHTHDVSKLIAVLNRLVDAKNTVIVIEHNLDVIKSADYIIDLGPEGGARGGEVVATGTPEEVAKVKRSFTGNYLKTLLS